ncbi:MGAT4C [Mytilus edulis]|uniref:MGAT4C n=1 Tax=Mytilus edulis TaxID=6550 RepID=A0A8S3RMY1_MYTED|nr:MGAT4C [Mytilus edulis]
MKNTRLKCWKQLLCIFIIVWIFNFLITVDVHIPQPLKHLLEIQEAQFAVNETIFRKNIVPNVRLTREAKKPEPDKKIHNSNENDNADASFFNSWRKQENDTLALPSPLSAFQQYYNKYGNTDDSVILYGHRRNSAGYLTLAIPTVKRPFNNYYYLNFTLNSLVSNIDNSIASEVVIVIFMADLDMAWNKHTARLLYLDFRIHFDSGLIHIISAPSKIYPDLAILKKTKADPVARVKWRSKQNIDFAFLMLYSQGINKYFIQLEDDILVAPGFLNDIKSFVLRQNESWICLEFSSLGFIGKMFHSKDLFSISSVLLSNFSSSPCDILLGYIRRYMGQPLPIHSPYSLFQHIGRISSLKNKMMPSVDIKFKGFGSKVPLITILPQGEKPPAKFKTDMDIVPGYRPENIYTNNSYFWAKGIKKRQYFKIIFEKPLNISRLIISTGNIIDKTDTLELGILKVGANEKDRFYCSDLRKVGNFAGGDVDSLIQGIVLPKNINCLHIEVKRTQFKWLIIRDLQVFIDRNSSRKPG